MNTTHRKLFAALAAFGFWLAAALLAPTPANLAQAADDKPAAEGKSSYYPGQDFDKFQKKVMKRQEETKSLQRKKLALQYKNWSDTMDRAEGVSAERQAQMQIYRDQYGVIMDKTKVNGQDVKDLRKEINQKAFANIQAHKQMVADKKEKERQLNIKNFVAIQEKREKVTKK